MCGRFALTGSADEIAAQMGIIGPDPHAPRYNIAPTQPIMMVLAGPPRAPGSNMPDRYAMLVRWGLIPTWVKDTRNFPLLFNARSEEAAVKASFRTAMRHRRALVPASGFYEWRQTGKTAGKTSGGRKKGQPYWIRPRHGGLIAFAGLMESYAEPGGCEMDTGTILTTRANSGLAHIHERMPAVIKQQDFTRWLNCYDQEPRDVADLLEPVEPDFFEAIPVTERVNKVANSGPEIQEEAIIGFGEEPPDAKRRRSGADDSQMTLF